MLECLTLAKAQLGETLSHDEQHFAAYNVATSTGTYALGLCFFWFCNGQPEGNKQI
jgi:hypothetical protein